MDIHDLAREGAPIERLERQLLGVLEELANLPEAGLGVVARQIRASELEAEYWRLRSVIKGEQGEHKVVLEAGKNSARHAAEATRARKTTILDRLAIVENTVGEQSEERMRLGRLHTSRST